MNYTQALSIVERYYEKSVFTLEETEAFRVVLDKCSAKLSTEKNS